MAFGGFVASLCDPVIKDLRVPNVRQCSGTAVRPGVGASDPDERVHGYRGSWTVNPNFKDDLEVYFQSRTRVGMAYDGG